MHSLRFFGLSVLLGAMLSFAAFSLTLHGQQPASKADQPVGQDAHLVTPQQLQHQLQTSTEKRQKEIEDLNQFLSTPLAQKAMKDSKIDPVQVKTAIPSLSDAELADLSARANQAQHDFSAGILGTTALLLIIIIILVIILVSIYH